MIILLFSFVKFTGFTSYKTIPGYPEIPVLRFYTDDTTGLYVKVEYAESLLKEPIFPHQPSWRKDRKRPPFYIDQSVYKMDKFIPESLWTIKKVGYKNNKPVYLVEVHTHRYNPVKGILRYPVSVSIKGEKSIERKNVKSVLFVGRSDLLERINDLIIFRLLEGYKTDTLIITTTDTSEIKNRIMARNPDAVILVGDVDAIPSFMDTISGAYGDLYYACDSLSINYFLPGRIYGRLSCDTSQIDDIVEKILLYETKDNYKSRCYFISTTDGTNHAIAESTHAYSMRVLRWRGYQCDSLWGYYSSGTPISEAFNTGRGLVVYSGHGYSGGWAGPSFSIGDVNNLNENKKPAIVWSFACQTGQFNYQECFTEALLRKKGGGGVASFGATNYSYWGEDDTLQRFMVDSFIPGRTIGEIVNYGKWALHQYYSDETEMMRYYMFIYNIMGDPLLSIHSGRERILTSSSPPEYFPTSSTFLFTLKDTSGSVPIYLGLYQNGSPVFDTSQTGSLEVSFSSFDTGRIYYYLASDSSLPIYSHFTLIPPGPYPVMDSIGIGGDTLLKGFVHNYGDSTFDSLLIIFSSLTEGFKPVPESLFLNGLGGFSFDTVSFSYLISYPYPSRVSMECKLIYGSHIRTDTLDIELPIPEFSVKHEKNTVLMARVNTLFFELENIGGKTAYHVSVDFSSDSGMKLIKGSYKFLSLLPGERIELSLGAVPLQTGDHYIDVSVTSSNVSYADRFLFQTGIPETLFVYRLKSSISNGVVNLLRNVSGLPVYVNLKYYDIAGRLVRDVSYTSGRDIQDRTDLPSGIYFLRWSLQNKEYINKLVIIRR